MLGPIGGGEGSSFGGKGGTPLSEIDSFGGSLGGGLPPTLVMMAPVSGSFGGRGGIGLPLSSLAGSHASP